MNKRIQELYKEVTGKDWTYDFDPQFAENFAELIVRECIQICQSEYNEFAEIAAKNNGRKSDFAFGRIDSAERIKDNIKEHFGVEE